MTDIYLCCSRLDEEMKSYFVIIFIFVLSLGVFSINYSDAQMIKLNPNDSNTFRIGHPMTLYLIDPDLNLDTDRAESHSLDLIIFRSDKIEITMGPAGGQQEVFNPKPSVLRETEKNSGIFYSVIEIPRKINGQTIQFGEKIEFEYRDRGSSASVFVGQNFEKSIVSGYISNLGAKIFLAKNSGFQAVDEGIIPSWIKTSAKWWAQDVVPDASMMEGIDYLIQQDIVNTSEQNPIQKIHDWFKITSLLWAEGIITDTEYVNSIEFLIDKKIISF